MDFNSISSKAGSMKRKQSTSLLQALGKPASRASAIPISPAYNTPPTATSSHFHDASTSSSGPYSPDIMTSGQYTDSVSSRAPSSQFNPPPSVYHYQNTQSSGSGSSYNLPLHSSRSVSGSGSMLSRESTDKGAKSTKDAQVIRRPDDVFRVVKERLFSWSYMMQWYQGDVHWLNTVKVTKSSLESSLGPAKVDQRARNFFVLGTSMSALFDINSVTDFLRSLLRLLDEWETFAEGGGKVKNLFRGQRGGRKPTGGPISDMSAGFNDGESLIVNFNLPFSPDFFQAHSSTCSIIRDLYKKILGMVLPAAPGQIMPKVVSTEYDALFHPSTVIHSAPLASPPLNSANPLSPGARSVSSQSQRPNYGQTDPTGGFYTPGHQNSGSIAQTPPSAIQHDAFQAHVAGELPENQVLVGDGQKLTPQVVELFIKVDTRLKKHFSILSREGDALARKVLVDELALITSSLKTGAPLKFDMTAALSSTGNGHWPDDAGGFDGAETPQTGSYGMY